MLIAGVLLALTFIIVRIAVKLFLIPIAGFVGLMVYILVTCHRWHRQHGVFCPHCTRSLIEVNDQLEEIFLGAPAPDTLVCPNCGSIIAKR